MGIFESLQPSAELFAKPSFPFAEPSHVAIVAAPFLIFTCAYARPAARIGYLLAALGMTALLQNLTLAAVCILAALLCLRLKHLIVVALLILPLILTIDLNYYLTRFEFNKDTQNISRCLSTRLAIARGIMAEDPRHRTRLPTARCLRN